MAISNSTYRKKDDMSENPHITLIQVARPTKNTNFFRNFTSVWRGTYPLGNRTKPPENTVKIKYNS